MPRFPGLRSPRPSRWLACVLLPVLAAAAAIAAAAQDAPGKRLEEVERELKGLGSQAERLAEQRAEQRSELRRIEVAIGKSEARRRELLESLGTRKARLRELRGELSEARAQVGNLDQGLVQALRLAYVLSRRGPWPLLLGSGDPARYQRLLTYHRYLSTAQHRRLDEARSQVARLLDLERRNRETLSELAETRRALDQTRAELEDRAAERRRLLARIGQRHEDTVARIERLKDERAELQGLLERLERERRARAQDFARQRGHLPWPVNGEVRARYGERRGDGPLRWRGLLIAATPGSEVHAVAPGEVRYADWLRGFGLLVILDHGDGYLTLYAHNRSLRVGEGEAVAAGQVIAEAGASGGRAESGLYFELRRKGKPVDPGPWLARR